MKALRKGSQMQNQFPRIKFNGKWYYEHWCKWCKRTFLDKDYWVKGCLVCKKDYTKSLGHMIRNALYGNDRHPNA